LKNHQNPLDAQSELRIIRPYRNEAALNNIDNLYVIKKPARLEVEFETKL